MTADLHALSGAYALDALDDAERTAFSRHLDECEPCRTEVAGFHEVAANLGEPYEAPPASMRADVLTAIKQTPQLPRQRQAPIVVRIPPLKSAERWRRAALAIAATAVLAVGGLYAVLNHQLSAQQNQVQTLKSERDRIYAVMNARDVVMKGADMPDGGRIAAAVSASEHGGVAMLAGLRQPPAGQTYQMWVFTNGTPTSAAILPVGIEGGTLAFDWQPGSTAFGITREPVGGSPAPTMAPLATVNLS
ncbi:anti-sigma-K factor RskA [Hamadaea flava]|uniref:Regulator of SigK n=1 Tax=Hamadaea flava TaxID=1742688 RepID=A0ABV8LRL2_9ACTN|nr:anti-sigma factor [Hamadaea flava]MCP2322287.1 anti-sigma-K factor RskA [Hamadaea flava]